jgi:hypothetical protein
MSEQPRTFAENCVTYYEPASIWLMVLGIVVLCQPFSLALHSYGVTVILLGLIGFNVFSKFKPPANQGSSSAHGRDHT